MSKVHFNNKNYLIDDSIFSSHSNDLKQHFSSAMNGSGATISFGGTTYNIDSDKLVVARNDFISYLNTIAGNGHKVVVNGVEYGIDSDKLAKAITDIEAVLGGATTFFGARFSDGVELLWDELMLEENGTKYGYNHSMLSDTSVGNYTFQNCTNLVSISIPEGVQQIGAGLFNGCTNLTEINIPSTVTSIVMNAFAGCSGLVDVVLPSTVTSLGNSVFANCSNLKSVSMLGVSQIPSSLFPSCPKLENIYVSENLTSISAGAFGGSNSVTINYSGTMEQWNNVSISMGVYYKEVICSNGVITK